MCGLNFGSINIPVIWIIIILIVVFGESLGLGISAGESTCSVC